MSLDPSVLQWSVEDPRLMLTGYYLDFWLPGPQRRGRFRMDYRSSNISHPLFNRQGHVSLSLAEAFARSEPHTQKKVHIEQRLTLSFL